MTNADLDVSQAGLLPDFELPDHIIPHAAEVTGV